MSRTQKELLRVSRATQRLNCLLIGDDSATNKNKDNGEQERNYWAAINAWTEASTYSVRRNTLN